MESEPTLHEDVDSLRGIAVSVEYFAEFLELGAVEVLLGLLGHENVDIDVTVQSLFVELLDLGLVVTTNNDHDHTGGDDNDCNTNGDQANREHLKKDGPSIATLALVFLGNQPTTSTSVHHIHNHNNPPADSHPTLTNGGLEMCVSNLQKFDQLQEEELKGIDDLLILVENLLDLDRMGVSNCSTPNEPTMTTTTTITTTTACCEYAVLGVD